MLLRSFDKWEEGGTGSVAAVPRAQREIPPESLRLLGAALKTMREDRGMKQIELATAAGATESQVSDIERGRNNPGWLLIARLLDGLGASAADLGEAYARAEHRDQA